MEFHKNDIFIFDNDTTIEIINVENDLVTFKIGNREYLATNFKFKMLWLGEDGNELKPIRLFNRKDSNNFEFNMW